uniref:Uncharacterized protein n=1 Tax=Peronospora matthiolae TaxID=2874970 RepID=A0AAV1TPJ1_9STRA
MPKNHDLEQEEVGDVEDLMHVMRSAANEQSVLVRVYSIDQLSGIGFVAKGSSLSALSDPACQVGKELTAMWTSNLLYYHCVTLPFLCLGS